MEVILIHEVLIHEWGYFNSSEFSHRNACQLMNSKWKHSKKMMKGKSGEEALQTSHSKPSSGYLSGKASGNCKKGRKYQPTSTINRWEMHTKHQIRMANDQMEKKQQRKIFLYKMELSNANICIINGGRNQQMVF